MPLNLSYHIFICKGWRQHGSCGQIAQILRGVGRVILPSNCGRVTSQDSTSVHQFRVKGTGIREKLDDGRTNPFNNCRTIDTTIFLEHASCDFCLSNMAEISSRPSIHVQGFRQRCTDYGHSFSPVATKNSKLMRHRYSIRYKCGLKDCIDFDQSCRKLVEMDLS
jgi:hypothetical protein